MSQALQIAATLISVPANADLSAKQYHFMNVNSSGKLVASSAGARVAGVLNNDPDAADKPGSLQIAGVAKVLAAGTITAGGGVAADAAGKAVASTGSDNVAGIALNSVATGEYCQVLLTGASANAISAEIETVTSGALNPAVPITHLSVTGTQAYTLADGTYSGQRKKIVCTVAATTPVGTLTITTPETLAGLVMSSTAVFNTVGQELVLEWTGTKWRCISIKRAGTTIPVVGTTVLTGVIMNSLYSLSVTGTVVSSTTKGIPNGVCVGDRCVVGCSTAATTPVGSITGTYIDRANAAKTDLQAIGVVDTDFAILEWNGLAWLITTVSGITVA